MWNFVEFFFREHLFGENSHLVDPVALANFFKASVCEPVGVGLKKMRLGNFQLIDVQEPASMPLIIAETTS